MIALLIVATTWQLSLAADTDRVPHPSPEDALDDAAMSTSNFADLARALQAKQQGNAAPQPVPVLPTSTLPLPIPADCDGSANACGQTSDTASK